jgi:hypothetical protein
VHGRCHGERSPRPRGIQELGPSAGALAWGTAGPDGVELPHRHWAHASTAYAALMRHVRNEEWPRLERAAGVTLITPGDVVFFGPDRATLANYAAAVVVAGGER